MSGVLLVNIKYVPVVVFHQLPVFCTGGFRPNLFIFLINFTVVSVVMMMSVSVCSTSIH